MPHSRCFAESGIHMHLWSKAQAIHAGISASRMNLCEESVHTAAIALVSYLIVSHTQGVSPRSPEMI